MSKFFWGGLHPFFYHPFISNFTPDLKGKTILDCGCGKGIMGYLTRATRDLSGSIMVGIDVGHQSLAFCRAHKVYDRLIKHTLPSIPFKNKTADFLLCTEVIEHLTKKDGHKLLTEIDRVCRGRAIVSTPNVFYQNPPGEKGDVHRSLWTTADFKKHGYKVYGLGLKTSLLVTDPYLRLKQALYYLFTPLSYFIPQLGGFIIAVKDYGQNSK